jgi:hypothetical protein
MLSSQPYGTLGASNRVGHRIDLCLQLCNLVAQLSRVPQRFFVQEREGMGLRVVLISEGSQFLLALLV